jgi:hypothetical protein
LFIPPIRDNAAYGWGTHCVDDPGGWICGWATRQTHISILEMWRGHTAGYSCPCPTIHVNTAAVPNSSAVSLFLLLVVVVTYVPASSAKRKRRAFSNGPKGTNGRPFLLICAPLAAP